MNGQIPPPKAPALASLLQAISPTIAQVAASVASQTIKACFGGAGDFHATYVEALRQAGIKGSPNSHLVIGPPIQQLITASIGLGAAPATSPTSVNVTYTSPNEEAFLVREMSTIVVPSDVSALPLALGALTPMTVTDWIRALAAAATYQLYDETNQKYITSSAANGSLGALPLSVGLPENGRIPQRFDIGSPGWVLRKGEQITATFGWNGGVTGTVTAAGQNITVGLLLSGNRFSLRS